MRPVAAIGALIIPNLHCTEVWGYVQAVWALGNIAGDSPMCRDMVLEQRALVPLLEQLKDSSKLSMQRNATWTLSNFCRGKPQPAFEQARATLVHLTITQTYPKSPA